MGSLAPTFGRIGRGVSFLPAGLLTNGEYVSLVTASGAGGSFWRGDALTRFRPDRTADTDGVFFYLREGASLRSLTRLPAGGVAEREEVTWLPGMFAVERVTDDLESRIEVCVAPDRPLELRRVHVRNLRETPRRLDLASYLETVLQRAEADASHPAFSKLFVETSFDARHEALVARRRPRDRGERHPWLAASWRGAGRLDFDTDRARLWGRGRFAATPFALSKDAALAGVTGDVLDPAFCLRRRFELEPGAAETFTLALAAGESREEALETLGAAATRDHVDAIFLAACAYEIGLLDRLGLDDERAEALQALWLSLRYGLARPRGRAASADRARYGAPPDDFYVYFHVRRADQARRAAELVRTHQYWRTKGLASALILVYDSGIEPVRAEDGCAVWPAAQVPAEDRASLEAHAAWVADEQGASFELRFDDVELEEPRPVPPRAPGREARSAAYEELAAFNGFGGFSAGGAEYVVRLDGAQEGGLRLPPQPWVNVIARADFGFLVSETGSISTWGKNSRERRITPWSNDPVLDPHGEAFYVRDEESGALWSALPGPAPGPGRYEARHGLGYSRFLYEDGGLEHETRLFLAPDAPVQIAWLSIVHRGKAERHLSVHAFRRLVLGSLPERTSPQVLTERDAETGALFATNPRTGEFADGVTFAVLHASDARADSYTCDREEFLGPGGNMAAPAALGRLRPLSALYGGGLDPCFAQRLSVRLRPGEKITVIALLGETSGAEEARAAIRRYQTPETVAWAWEETLAAADEMRSAIQVETPSSALDYAMNGWLAYQTLACRMIGRTAFYQSGGAFGYRDQLQDAGGLAWWDAKILRDQIVLHAAHQFVQGDVLHWWHPPLGRGLRTRFADDLVWLPYAVAHYVDVTGDESVLDERARFLTARELEPGEDEAYLLPEDSGTAGDVYEHCVRAFDRAMTAGPHGLPLFGSGDWNDGMNRVGREGRGESVWMGFFLFAALGDFLPICERRGDAERAQRYRAYRESLRAAIERDGWDGAWYRRAYYDDGAPMGSRESDECQIDALVQAWSVISGAAPAERAARAMDAAEAQLVSEKDGLIRLLTPPFQHTSHDPGYIRGYAPGVRENGGQYTHAALWVVRALAELGRRNRAARLLEMLAPLSHARTPEDVARYRVEPYVIAADVYGEPPHVGRGGWTWYTGSAGWMLRVGLESILGLRVRGGRALEIRPCVPDEWPEYRITYRPRGRSTCFHVHVTNPARRSERVREARLDGEPWPLVEGAVVVPIDDDSLEHTIEIVLG